VFRLRVIATVRSVRNAFRTVALVEAVTWAALLVAMFFKWVVQDDPHAGIEGGVPYAGMAHGVAFVAYVVVTLLTWRHFRWSPRVGLTALACGIPPFATVVFEVKADRRGLLDRAPRESTTVVTP
jgi:integral membrane protein